MLAGGRGSRLGGTSKALLRISGRPALARVVDALIDAERSVIAVVGPAGEIEAALGHEGASGRDADTASVIASDRVRVAIETERFGGPAVAIKAGIVTLVDAGVPIEALVDLLACDLVRPVELVAALDAQRVRDDADGVMLVDRDGHDQWLATRIHLGALNAALAGSAAGDSLRRRLGGLDLVRVEAPDGVTVDVDTPADVAAYGAVVHLGQRPLCL